jgi:hypothetical protein
MGFHTGPVVTPGIGTKNAPRFTLIGDTVNTGTKAFEKQMILKSVFLPQSSGSDILHFCSFSFGFTNGK